ncbi:unnamed protein product, partial [Cladocopium goreaui]
MQVQEYGTAKAVSTWQRAGVEPADVVAACVDYVFRDEEEEELYRHVPVPRRPRTRKRFLRMRKRVFQQEWWGPRGSVRIAGSSGSYSALPYRLPLTTEELLSAPDKALQAGSAIAEPEALNALGKQKEKESMEKRQRRQRKDLGMSWDGMGTQTDGGVCLGQWDHPALPIPGMNIRKEKGMAAKERDAEEGRRWSMPSFDLRYNSSRGTVQLGRAEEPVKQRSHEAKKKGILATHTHEFSASKYFVRMMMTHPWRTWDPKVAEVFIVPTDVEPVYLEEGSQGPCSARQYQVHLWGAIQALFEKPHIRAKQGADHFWMMSQNDPERLIEKHAPELAEEIRALNYLHFMSVGAMELFPLRSLEAHPVRESIFVLNGTRRNGGAWGYQR